MTGSPIPTNAAAQPGQPAAAAAAPATPAGAQGQGATTPGNGLYDQILNAIPEQVRGDVEPHLKEWDANVTQMRQGDVDFRNQWEPFSQIEGLSDLAPETISELVAFSQLAGDEDAFGEWLLNEAKARDLIDMGDDGLDPAGADGLDLSDPQALVGALTESVKGILDERLGPIEGRFSKMDETERVEAANKEIDETFKALHAEHGEFDDEKVMRFALSYSKDGTIGGEAINAAFADLQGLISQSQTGMFEQKAGQPATPEQGGRPATAKAKPTNFGEAREAALELARQSSAT